MADPNFVVQNGTDVDDGRMYHQLGISFMHLFEAHVGISRVGTNSEITPVSCSFSRGPSNHFVLTQHDLTGNAVSPPVVAAVGASLVRT